MRATSPSGILEVQIIHINVHNFIFVSTETYMLKKIKERNSFSLYQELNYYGNVFNRIYTLFPFEIAWGK